MNSLLLKLSSEEINDLLFRSLMAVHRFELGKIKRFGLGYMEILALQILRRHSPLRMRELVKGLGLPFSTTTRLFSRLEESGYVKRVYAQEDRRGVHIYITEEGEDIVRRIEAHSFEVLTENTRSFNNEMIQHIVETARQMETILAVESTILPEEELHDNDHTKKSKKEARL